MRPSKEPEGDHPVAHPFTFEHSGPYSKSFEGSGFGVVFEDDGETGYFYATDEKHATIFDALHLYNPRDPNRLKAGEKGLIVWNGAYLRAGLFYHERFQAVIDFKNKVSCCRTGFPAKVGSWSLSNHQWKEELTEGLRPR